MMDMVAADVILMNEDLIRATDTIKMIRLAVHNIKLNLFYNLPTTSLVSRFLAPWVAGAAMAFSSISVMLNALRLQQIKLRE